MRDKKQITQFMLELYHLNAVTEKERKLIENAITTDVAVRLRYEKLKKIDIEIKNKINNPPVFTVVKYNSNERVINRSDKIKYRKILIGTGIAVAILCLCIPIFIHFNKKVSETEITKNDIEYNIEIEEKQIIVFDDNNYNFENERIVILPNETKETETKVEKNQTNKIVRETEPIVIAEVPNNENGVYVRGVATEQKPIETTENNTVTIPAGINFIFDSMFANRGLTDIVIPERVTFISNNAFENNQIRNIVIPENVTSIGSGAFLNNPLISITIGADVFMEDDAFPANFAYFYNVYDKLSGTYTRTNISSNEWSKQ